MQQLVAKLQIGAEQRETGSGGVFEHRHPVSGAVQATIPLAGASEMDEAVAKAVAAFEPWRRWKPEARREVLLRLAQLIREHTE